MKTYTLVNEKNDILAVVSGIDMAANFLHRKYASTRDITVSSTFHQNTTFAEVVYLKDIMKTSGDLGKTTSWFTIKVTSEILGLIHMYHMEEVPNLL